MASEPAHLPGHAPLAEARDRVAGILGVEIPAEPGLDVMHLLDAAAAGTLPKLFVVGWDLLLTQPNANVTRRALSRLDTLVIVDLFLNKTATELGTLLPPPRRSRNTAHS